MNELHLEYKKETGFNYNTVEAYDEDGNSLMQEVPEEDHIEWLEKKAETLFKLKKLFKQEL